jgi:hypothetical protein
MPNEILQHDDEANELARVAPSVPVSATGTTAQTANGLSQPTPGPWEWDGRFTVTIPHRTGDAPFRTNPEDARLIVAAPDLLLSVKEFVALYAGTRDLLGPSVQAKLARAEAAIQKAGAQ